MRITSHFGPSTMEDSSIPHQNGGSQSGSVINNKQNEENAARTQYSIPGILHFIQHEWARFELERSQWEVDRAELQARIAFLQGERKGQENLKNDLVRRIKMLEYALKQERGKYHKLKYGVELQQGDMKPPALDELGGGELGGGVGGGGELGADYSSVSSVTWREGRQLLRQYLQEIGYTDMIIDVRNLRVRSLLGLNNNAEQEENHNNGNAGGGGEGVKRLSESQGGRRTPAKRPQPPPASVAEAMLLDTEAAVMANFEFLSNVADVDMDEDDEMSDEADGEATSSVTAAACDDVDAEAEDVLNELNLLTEARDTDVTAVDSGAGDVGKWGRGAQDSDAALGLGELAQLTVNNDAESTYDVSSSKEAFRKTWNAKYTLRSHFDGVRALAFHPVEPVLVTASEDHTLKLWNLQKTVPAKKSASLDVEPLYTFRRHTGPVLCVAMADGGDVCYSGGLDGRVCRWRLPSAAMDPYDSYEPDVLAGELEGHSDAVWGVSVRGRHVLTCSADGAVRMWRDDHAASIGTYTSERDGTPCCADFVRDDAARCAVAYSSCACVLYDTETGAQAVRLDWGGGEGRLVNRLVCHPTLALTVTAHEDRHIRFWDNNTGKLVHSMVAHLDAVTSLAIDPNGLYLLSGSHDCSIRLWHLDNKTCVQEITAHRKKFDESILDVAFHPSRPYIASAGADGLAKVFV